MLNQNFIVSKWSIVSTNILWAFSVFILISLFTIENANNIVLPEVLKTVCHHIDDEWKTLARYIGITEYDMQNIDFDSKTTALKMMKCFENINNNITWKYLKTQLQKVNRYEIIELIKKESLLTIGMFRCHTLN